MKKSKTSGPNVVCYVCGDIIYSKHRHDFVRCQCGNLAVDGGSDYTKISSNTDKYKILNNDIKRISK